MYFIYSLFPSLPFQSQRVCRIYSKSSKFSRFSRSASFFKFFQVLSQNLHFFKFLPKFSYIVFDQSTGKKPSFSLKVGFLLVKVSKNLTTEPARISRFYSFFKVSQVFQSFQGVLQVFKSFYKGFIVFKVIKSLSKR